MQQKIRIIQNNNHIKIIQKNNQIKIIQIIIIHVKP